MKKSKKIILTLVIIILAVTAIVFYEIFRFKPVPPITDEQGRILSTPENAFRNYKTHPETY